MNFKRTAIGPYYQQMTGGYIMENLSNVKKSDTLPEFQIFLLDKNLYWKRMSPFMLSGPVNISISPSRNRYLPINIRKIQFLNLSKTRDQIRSFLTGKYDRHRTPSGPIRLQEFSLSSCSGGRYRSFWDTRMWRRR